MQKHTALELIMTALDVIIESNVGYGLRTCPISSFILLLLPLYHRHHVKAESRRNA